MSQEMSSTTTQDAFSRALGKEVAIGSVDKELRLLWEADKASTNASLINLAVYSEETEAIIRNSEIVQEITREHACRAILIGIDRACPDASIRAWITAHCHLAHGRKSVCCEQLAFQLTGRATGRLRNTVFAHLNSDLPLVFWWQGELSPIFSERLYSLIDRFIFDSSEWDHPSTGYQLIQQARQSSESFLAMDLEWTRSYAMRLALAGLFDDPMATRTLPMLNHVRIVVHPDHRMAGLQILAWLMDCMKWRCATDLGILPLKQGDRFTLENSNGSDVYVQLESEPSSAPVGLIELASSDNSVRVSREMDSPQLHQEIVCGDHRVHLASPAGQDAREALVMDQLSRGGKNTLFSRILPTFLGLIDGHENDPEVLSVR